MLLEPKVGPGGSDTQVQFNDGGVFGGSDRLTWDNAANVLSALSGDATADALISGYLGYGAGSFVNATPFNNGLSIVSRVNLGNPSGIYAYVESVGAAGDATAYTLEAHIGVDAKRGYATYSSVYVNDGIAASETYGHYVNGPSLGAGASATNHFSFYSAGLGNAATNAYSFWHDEQGVLRIKADNTFNSVYQAILALYNPQFTKYAAGAANYERIVQQWESNVATIRAEAGGTGTLRAINLAGATVQLNGKVVTLSGDLTTTGAFNPTFAIPSSSTWTFPSGGGTLALTTISALTGPVTITEAVGSSALTLTGATQTASFPALLVTQTFNNAGVTFTGALFNFTNTASASGSKLLDVQLASTTVFGVRRDGYIILGTAGSLNWTTDAATRIEGSTGSWSGRALALTINSNNIGNLVYWSTAANGLQLRASSTLSFGALSSSPDVLIGRGGAAATVQFGSDVNGAAVPQTLQAANGITGTDRTGGNFTFASGKGTGAGAVSSLIFQTPAVLASGTTAQTSTTRLTITEGSLTIADATNFVLNATTGTKIGTETTQKLGFWNQAPTTQPAGVADASGGAIIDAEARTAINTLISRLESTGLIATV